MTRFFAPGLNEREHPPATDNGVHVEPRNGHGEMAIATGLKGGRTFIIRPDMADGLPVAAPSLPLGSVLSARVVWP